MRILIVTQYFWPENFKINDLVDELVKRNHQITVLTGKPNYPDGEIFSEFKKNPSFFNQFNGSNVIRVPLLKRGRGGSLRLIMNYFSFFISATLVGGWKLKGRQFDIIFVFQPSPITVGLPAIFFKKLKKIPVVFWVLDLWPESLETVSLDKSNFVMKLAGMLVSFIYKRCDLILGVSKPFCDGISDYCKDHNKIKYFPSWSENVFSNLTTSRVTEIEQYKDTFKILFAGNIGDMQDFPSILKTAEILKGKKAKVKFFIVGDGRSLEWLKSEIVSLKLQEYIYLLGRHPLELMPSFYASADALLLTLKLHPVLSMWIPGKAQSYMSAGKPILTMLSGEGSRIVEEANCGYIASSGDYKKLAQNILIMSELCEEKLDKLGNQAVIYVKQEFDRNKLITKLENWFTGLYESLKERKL